MNRDEIVIEIEMRLIVRWTRDEDGDEMEMEIDYVMEMG